jgi:hypothetical protein
MASGKDRYTRPGTWNKHLRKILKRIYWKKSRQNSKKIKDE